MGNLSNRVDWAWICLYGRVGTGKTTSMAHGAKLGPTIHVDAENRIKAGPLRRLGVPIDNITAINDLDFEYLVKVVNHLADLVHDNNPERPVMFGIDAVDETIKLMIGEIMQVEIDIARRKAARQGVEYQPTRDVDRDYWNEMTQRMRDLLRKLRAIDVHVMFTSHERRTVDEDTKTVSYGPAATPAVQSDLMAYCDVVGHLTIEHGFHIANFASGTRYEAKDAFGVLPPKLANPTADRIIGYIAEDLYVENDPIQQQYLDKVEEALAESVSANSK